MDPLVILLLLLALAVSATIGWYVASRRPGATKPSSRPR